MKSLTRIIIVLVIINLTIGNFAAAQNTPIEPRSISRSGTSEPATPKPSRPEAADQAPQPEPVPTPIAAPPASSQAIILSGRIGLSGSKGPPGLSGVEMQGLPGNPVTDENGFYSATVPYGFSGTIRPVKKGYFFQPNTKSYSNITENLYKCFTAIRIGRISPPPMFARTGSRKVLVIPATDVKAEDLAEITEDLQVMIHIFDERFKKPQEIQGIFVDFGDIFGRDSRSTEAIYMQGYGALFLMEVNFAFSPESKPQEQEVKKTEKYVDPDWQRAKQKLFSRQGFGGTFIPEEQYSAEQIDQIKTELIRTLKHTANIRNLKSDERVILTVIGQVRQPGRMYEDYYRSADPRTGMSGSSRSRGRSSSSSRGGYGGGMMGGGMGGMVGGGIGGGMGGMAGGSMGGQAFGGGVMMGGGIGGGMYGGMEYGETGSASTTVLTIRAKKTDVDAFAIGKLDFEEFQEKVDIFMY